MSEPTKWVNPLIILEKPNGKIPMCLDPKHLNQVKHYKLPTAAELFSEKHNSTFSSKLYASSGYCQIKVDKESSKLLTKCKWSFPTGQQRNNSGLWGDKNIIIWGLTLNQLDIHTEQFLNRIQKSGLKVNKDKCVFGATELIFLVNKISGKGISPEPGKVKAINSTHIPKSKQDVQHLLNMTAYLIKVIPDCLK